jgi:hypothetical protein
VVLVEENLPVEPGGGGKTAGTTLTKRAASVTPMAMASDPKSCGDQSRPRPEDLVECAAVEKVRAIRGGPAAEHGIDGEQLDCWELVAVIDLGASRDSRPVETTSDDVLAGTEPNSRQYLVRRIGTIS